MPTTDEQAAERLRRRSDTLLERLTRKLQDQLDELRRRGEDSAQEHDAEWGYEDEETEPDLPKAPT